VPHKLSPGCQTKPEPLQRVVILSEAFFSGVEGPASVLALAFSSLPQKLVILSEAFFSGVEGPASHSTLAPSTKLRARSLRLFRTSPSLALIILIAVLLAFSPNVPAQDTPTFTINSKLVNLWVNVSDKSGAIVGGLKKDDFKIAEDGRPQDIAIFERQSEQPLAIILAIDTSESTYKDRALEQDAGKRFVHAILRPQDQMSVIQFATNVSMLVDFTNKPDRVDRGLGSLKSGEATALYEAIYLGSKELAKKEGRKVLVLVSDGGDTVKSTTYKEAVDQALRGEVMIYSIIDVPIESSAGRDLGGEHALITLAEQTGGKSFYASSGGLDKAFAQVSDDLRTQYLIGYYPHHQAPGLDFHHVSVTIPRAGADSFNIRYRAGYYPDIPSRPRVPVD
jgi:Ca-activated chloride channel family protein